MAPSSYSSSLVPRFAVPRSPQLTESSSNEDGVRRQRERQKNTTFRLAKQENQNNGLSGFSRTLSCARKRNQPGES